MVTKSLDFNALNRPVLSLTMMDDAKTVIRVGLPTESMLSELKAASNHLASLKDGEEGTVSDGVYDLAARLISCNRDGIKVTAEELRYKYNLDLEALIIFFGTFADFVTEVASSKN